VNTFEIGMHDVSKDVRSLRDDELRIVAGGADRPPSRSITMLDYEGSPVVTYSLPSS
jgi:hypothetical protein